jgi:anti-anti-sigma factor
MLREQSVQLRIQVYWHRGESVVIVQGDLDGVSAADLSERLLEIDEVLRVLNGQPRRLVVGLAEVGFANQAAARILAATRQELAPECQLLLQSPSRALRKVLAPAGLLDDRPLTDGHASGAPGDGRASRATGRRGSRP